MSEQLERPQDAEAQDANRETNFLLSSEAPATTAGPSTQDAHSLASTVAQHSGISAGENHSIPGFKWVLLPGLHRQDPPVDVDAVNQWPDGIYHDHGSLNDSMRQVEHEQLHLSHRMPDILQGHENGLRRALSVSQLARSGIYDHQSNQMPTVSIPAHNNFHLPQPHAPSAQLGFNPPAIRSISNNAPYQYPALDASPNATPYFQQQRSHGLYDLYQPEQINPTYNPHSEPSIQPSFSFPTPADHFAASAPPSHTHAFNPLNLHYQPQIPSSNPGLSGADNDPQYNASQICNCALGKRFPEFLNAKYTPFSNTFTTWADARANLKKVKWTIPGNDTTIPQTDAEKLVWVKRLYAAVIDGAHIHDNLNEKGKNNSVIFAKYLQQDIEAACWNAVQAAVKLHTKGANLTRLADPTQENKEAEYKQHTRKVARNLNFQQRMTQVCRSARLEKAYAKDIVDGANMVKRAVYVPKKLANSKGSNRKGNKEKQDQIKEGQKAQAKKRGESLVDGEAEAEGDAVAEGGKKRVRGQRSKGSGEAQPAAFGNALEVVGEQSEPQSPDYEWQTRLDFGDDDAGEPKAKRPSPR